MLWSGGVALVCVPAALKPLTYLSKPLPIPSTQRTLPSKLVYFAVKCTPLPPSSLPRASRKQPLDAPVKTIDGLYLEVFPTLSKPFPPPPSEDRWLSQRKVASPLALVCPLNFPSSLLLTARSLVLQGAPPVHLSEEVVRPEVSVASTNAGRARESPVPVPTPMDEPIAGQQGLRGTKRGTMGIALFNIPAFGYSSNE